MHKSLLHMIAVGLFCSMFFLNGSSDDTEHLASCKDASNLTAICKTVFDIITLPLAIIPTGYYITHKVTPYVQTGSLPAEISNVMGFLSGVGAGCAAYLLLRKLFIIECKKYGFSDSDIKAMCEKSRRQEAALVAEGCTAAAVVVLTALLKAIAASPIVVMNSAMTTHNAECDNKDMSYIKS